MALSGPEHDETLYCAGHLTNCWSSPDATTKPTSCATGARR